MDELDYLILIARHGILSVISLVFLLTGVALVLPALHGAIFKQKRPKWLWYAGAAGFVIAIILFGVMMNESMSMKVWFWAK